MNRRNWWMALFAPSAAAQTVITQGAPMPAPPNITWQDGQWLWDGKPMQGGGAPPKGINNQCPVCGTVAPKRRIHYLEIRSKFMTDTEILDALENNRWSVIAPIGRFASWKVGTYGGEDIQMASGYSLRSAVKLMSVRSGEDNG